MTTKKYIITADDVEDNLTSTLQDVPLSANQGRVLNTGKVDKNQGTAYAGKVLGIGADGLVYAMDAGTAAHASSHASGGSDAVSLAASQITSGTLAAARLPKATTSAVGGVKVGSGLSVASDGTLSASGGGGVPTATITPVFSGYGNDADWSALVDGTGAGYSFPCAVSGTLRVAKGASGSLSLGGILRVLNKNGSVTKVPLSGNTMDIPVSNAISVSWEYGMGSSPYIVPYSLS